MTPVQTLVLTLSCGVIMCGAYRAGKWIGNRIIDTIEYLCRFEER